MREISESLVLLLPEEMSNGLGKCQQHSELLRRPQKQELPIVSCDWDKANDTNAPFTLPEPFPRNICLHSELG